MVIFYSYVKLSEGIGSLAPTLDVQSMLKQRMQPATLAILIATQAITSGK